VKMKLRLLAGGIGFSLVGYLYRMLMIDAGSYGKLDSIFFISLMIMGGMFIIPLLMLLLVDFLNIITGTITRGFDFLMGFVKGFRVVRLTTRNKR